MQQKVRRVPIQLQDAVQAAIDRLLEEGHIEKVNEVTIFSTCGHHSEER